MKLEPTPLEGLYIASSERFVDARGAFARLFCEDALAPALGGRHIVQINHSLTRAPGAVRGLHYQHPPHAEMKLVRCLAGRVFDVAVDLRAGSPTFLKWHALELSPQNHQMFIIPEGFAHGFQALEADSALLYLHTAAYAPGAEGGLHPLDPRLKIAWPRPVEGLSDRDAHHPALAEDFTGVKV